MYDTKLNHKQIREVLKEASSMRRRREDIRYGQSVFNSLYQLFPEVANSIRGTENDPFYNDSIVNKCINFVFNNKTDE